MKTTVSNVLVASLLVALPACRAKQPTEVLAPGSSLPAGFTSIEATGPPGKEGQRIEARFQDPDSGKTIRYITVRGSMSDVAPYEPVLPIDTCIRDANTGEVLFEEIFADKSHIAECGEDEDEADDLASRAPSDPAAHRRSYDAAMKGLAALKTVRFNRAYEPERAALVDRSDFAAPNLKLFQSGGPVVKEDERR